MNEADSMVAAIFGQSCYKIPNIKLAPFGVRTDTHPPTATRAPGMCNGHAMIESILEHAAYELGWSSLNLRQQNLMEKGDPVMPPPLTLSKQEGLFWPNILSKSSNYQVLTTPSAA